MNQAKSNSRIHKVCIECEKYSFCDRDVNMRKRCYQRWYNSTQRNPEVEKLRQALFRQKYFANSMLSRCKSQAAKANLYFGLDIKWFKAELAKGVCAATGISFVMPSYQPGAKGKRGPWTPSVDRIDNSKGYIKSNCRLVVWIYNLAKNSYEDADVHKMCAALVNHSRCGTVNRVSTQPAKTVAMVPVSSITRRTSASCWVRENSVTGTGSINNRDKIGGDCDAP